MKKKKRTPITEINITPLADVCTTLTIVFMITLPAMMWTGIMISSTKAITSAEVEQRERLPEVRDICKIDLTRSGIYINDVLVRDEHLQEELERLISQMENKTVIITSDAEVLFGKVVEVFDTAKQSGAEKLSLLKKAQQEG